MKKEVKEEWRKIKDYPRYEVSDLGRIRNIKTGRILRYRDNGKGYAKVLLAKTKNDYHSLYVHKLVVLAFPDICGELTEGYECDHISRNRMDCRAVNLRVTNRRLNILHSSVNDEPSYYISDKNKFILKTNLLGNTFSQTYDTYDDMLNAFKIIRDIKKKYYKRIVNKGLKELKNEEENEQIYYDCGEY
jgi:hypothetical protein